jgi:hypothetical protein
MDVTELRHAMTFSDTLARSLEEFRLTRLSKIAASSFLGESAKIILHLQPLSSAQMESPIDIGRIRLDSRKLMLMRNTLVEPDTRLNFDGLLAYTHTINAGYLQVFRNGTIEVVDTTIPSQRRLPIKTLERGLMITTTRCLGLMNDVGITSPVVVLHLTLLGVDTYRVEIEEDPRRFDLYYLNRQAEENPIQERDLLLPNIMIIEDELLRYANLKVADDDQSFVQLFRQTGTVLRPLFDIIWNAGGFRESPHFDEAGIWRGRV